MGNFFFYLLFSSFFSFINSIDSNLLTEFQNEEQLLGIDQAKFEAKFYFSSILRKEKLSIVKDQLFVRDHVYLKPGVKTPSQLEGMKEEFENLLRNVGSEMIFQASILLKLPILACITSQVIFHRFYYR